MTNNGRVEVRERGHHTDGRIRAMSEVRRMRKVFKVEPETENEADDLAARLKHAAQEEFDKLAAAEGLTASEARLVQRIDPAFYLPPSESGQRHDLIAYMFESDAT